MAEIWFESTIVDLAKFALIIFGSGFLPIYALCWVMEFFVGLRFPPTKRAAITVGTAYAIAAIAFVILSPIEYALIATLAPLPGAVVWFFYTRSHFRKAWFSEEAEIPDGVELANDSWLDGLLYLALAILIGISVLMVRLIRNGLLG